MSLQARSDRGAVTIDQGMGAVLYAACLLMLSNLAIGDLATAGAIGWTVTGLAALGWAWRRLSERRKAPPAPSVDMSDRERIRFIRLWLRDLGREDAALSDNDVRKLFDVVVFLVRHGRIASQELDGGRMRITVDMMDVAGRADAT